MLVYLFLSSFVLSQELPSSPLHTYTEQKVFDGTIEAGVSMIYGFSFTNPAIEYIVFDLEMHSGDAELIVATDVEGELKTWRSSQVGNDQVRVERTDAKLKRKELDRSFIVAVNSQVPTVYTLKVVVGSTRPLSLSADMVEMYTTMSTDDSVTIEDLRTRREGMETTGWVLMAVGTAAAGVFAGWLVYQQYRKTRAHDGYERFITV